MATDQRALVESITSWAKNEFGGAVRLSGDMSSNGDGFDSEVYFLTLAGESLPPAWKAPLVLRVKPTADSLDVARSEAAIQEWLADAGYPTPRVLRVFEPGQLLDRPAQVMERASGKMSFDTVRSKPWKAKVTIDMLASLHVRLHDLDPTGFPVDADLLDRRLGLTREVASTLDDAALLDGLSRVESVADQLRDCKPVVCHGDFHPLNAIVDGDAMSIIDWTDAGVGDLNGDVARTMLLMELAHIVASNSTERRILRYVGPRISRMYGKAYTKHGSLDERRVALWRPVHLLHGWSQVAGLRDGIFDGGDAQANAADRLPASLGAEFQARFESELAAIN